MSLRLLPVLLLLLLLPACTSWSSDEHVLVTSDPPGARILVDGIDTGRTTPAKLAIGGNFGRDHVVTLQKRGYRPARRRLYQYTEGYTAKWLDGAYEPGLPSLPLFWSAGDFFFPFGLRGALLPAELLVKLERDDEPKLGFDLLAERAAAASGQ
jgi:hypothetical protein